MKNKTLIDFCQLATANIEISYQATLNKINLKAELDLFLFFVGPAKVDCVPVRLAEHWCAGQARFLKLRISILSY